MSNLSVDPRIEEVFAARRRAEKATTDLEAQLPDENLSPAETFIYHTTGIRDAQAYMTALERVKGLEEQLRKEAGKEIALITKREATFTPRPEHIHPPPGEEPKTVEFTDYTVRLGILKEKPLRKETFYKGTELIFPMTATGILSAQEKEHIPQEEHHDFLRFDSDETTYKQGPLTIKTYDVPHLYGPTQQKELIRNLPRTTYIDGNGKAGSVRILSHHSKIITGEELETLKEKSLERWSAEEFNWENFNKKRNTIQQQATQVR